MNVVPLPLSLCTSIKPPLDSTNFLLIDKGLDALGQSPKSAIWVLLEKDFKLNRNELPGNAREFQEALQKIFGMGYNFLDRLFRHYLEEATGKKFQKSQSFCECVECLCFGQSS